MNQVTNVISAMASMQNAIIERLQDEDCTLGDLLDLEEVYGVFVWDAVYALVQERRAYVTVPLSRMDEDTFLDLVTWEVGLSSERDIKELFRTPSAAQVRGDQRVLVYDLYVEEAEDGYPSPPQPYAAREAADEDRPDGCNFPFTPIWPPEGLQVEFTFDHAGLLVRYEFKVGMRSS